MPNEVRVGTVYKHNSTPQSKQEFSSLAALLRITYHANISHDVKNREIYQDFCGNNK